MPTHFRVDPDPHGSEPEGDPGGHGALEDPDDLRVYGHLLPGSYDDVRARMDAYLAAGERLPAG